MNYSLTFPVDSPNKPPPPVTVPIDKGSPALAVLQGAVDINKDYKFTATYYGTAMGYDIDTIYGVEDKAPYYWMFYIQKPGCEPELAPVGVSNYIIPDPGYSVIFRYEIPPPHGKKIKLN